MKVLWVEVTWLIWNETSEQDTDSKETICDNVWYNPHVIELLDSIKVKAELSHQKEAIIEEK